MNKYGYCYKKKKCIDREEWDKDRKCTSFKKKGNGSGSAPKKKNTQKNRKIQSAPRREPTFPWERP